VHVIAAAAGADLVIDPLFPPPSSFLLLPPPSSFLLLPPSSSFLLLPPPSNPAGSGSLQLTPYSPQSPQVLIRESNHSFTFHASGRRFCRSLTAKVELKRRQDYLSLGWYFLQPRTDFVDIEVAMNEGAMAPMVSLCCSVSQLPEL